MTSKKSLWSSEPGIWFSIVAIIAILWNIVGALQFINSINANALTMKSAMMTMEQIQVVTSVPGWVTFVFGIGVITSLLGSVFLFLRHRGAMPTLILSLLAFIMLSVAYIIYGVFGALGAKQIITMSIVVVVAFVLVIFSRMIKSSNTI